MITTLNSSQLDCLSPLHLVLLLYFLFPSFGTYSSVTSFCIFVVFNFYVSGRVAVFPNMKEVVFCSRSGLLHVGTYPLCHTNALPSGHLELYSLGSPLCKLRGSFCCSRLITLGDLVGLAGPWSG